MYKIKNLIALEHELKTSMQKHFAEFFLSHDHKKPSRLVITREMRDLADADTTYSGRGLYVILSDYQIEQNKCTFMLDGLKAIYRGHGYAVKNRLKSHLFNDHYRKNLPERGVRYDVCMKLDDKNGININEFPYSNYRWMIVIHKMIDSSRMMREQAERAFDEVFNRPLASKDPG